MSDELSFEATMAELERIVDALGREEIDLDEALRLFEEGIRHVRRANLLLQDMGGRIEELIETSSGELQAEELNLPEEEGST